MKQTFANLDAEMNAFSEWINNSEYGKTLRQIEEALKDFFLEEEGEFGISSTPLSSTLCYLDRGFNGSEKRCAKGLASFLENWDIIYVDEQTGRADAERSNHSDVAQLVNRIIDLAEAA